MTSKVRVRAALPLAFAALCIPAGCPLLPGDQGDTGKPAALKRFESAEKLLSYFRDQASTRNRSTPPIFFGEDAAGTAGPDANAGDDGDSYSRTNLQEAGVDEADVFKSDGENFYVAKGNSLRIVRASPRDQLAEIGRLDLRESEYLDSLYLRGATVILLTHDYTYGAGASGEPALLIWPPYYSSALTRAYAVDVSEPTSPRITAQIEFDGSLASSRLTNDRLILVLAIVPFVPANPLALGLADLEDVLPRMRTNGDDSQTVTWNDWLRPDEPNGYYATAVVTLDADDITQKLASVGVMANAGTIYASTEAIYITDTEYDPDNNFRETTAIHKLAFDEQGAAQYVASGKVPGRLLNQFSLGERDGALRAATTIQPSFFALRDTGGVVFAALANTIDAAAAQEVNDEPPTVVTNGVYVLHQDGGVLEVVGSVDKIAPGERLFAARFLDNRGYLVTFEQIDPLFVLDLADDAAPQIVGELKIPGFSDYLHPLGETHLIGVGRSTGTTPFGGTVVKGVQLSLFDVSDPTNPTTVQQLEIGGFGSYTDVSSTHKAFTLHDGNLLAIPATLTVDTDDPLTYYQPEFDGVLCYTVDPATGFTVMGRLEAAVGEFYQYPYWHRAAVIGDSLYAVTTIGVSAAPLADLSESNQVVLEPLPGEAGGGIPVEDDGGSGASGGSAGQSEPGSPGSTGT